MQEGEPFCRKEIMGWLGKKICNEGSQLVRLMKGETTAWWSICNNLRVIETNSEIIGKATHV